MNKGRRDGEGMGSRGERVGEMEREKSEEGLESGRDGEGKRKREREREKWGNKKRSARWEERRVGKECSSRWSP